MIYKQFEKKLNELKVPKIKNFIKNGSFDMDDYMDELFAYNKEKKKIYNTFKMHICINYELVDDRKTNNMFKFIEETYNEHNLEKIEKSFQILANNKCVEHC